MSRLQCRGSIACAAFVVALLSSRAADAQGPVDPDGTRPPVGWGNPWVTGAQYDIANQAKAERRLQQVQARLRRDAERGDSAAVDRDGRRIANLKFRIVVDEWLIRHASLQDPGCYPYPVRLDAMSCDAIASAARPPDAFYPPQRVPTP